MSARIFKGGGMLIDFNSFCYNCPWRASRPNGSCSFEDHCSVSGMPCKEDTCAVFYWLNAIKEKEE